MNQTRIAMVTGANRGIGFETVRQLSKIDSSLKYIENSITNPFQKNRLKLFRGILDGKKAFTGPSHVEICISDFCNMNCLACWQYSPLVKSNYSSYFNPKKKNQMLPFRLFKEVVDDLHKLGVLEIRITGMGEPLFHPKIVDMAKYVKNYGIFCSIGTNGALITKDLVDKFCEIGLDRIDVSLWASSAKIYIKTHPNQNEKTFFNIKEWLKYLADIKSSYKNNKPRVLLVNVIFNENYYDLEDMMKFAIEIKADEVFFGAVHVTEDTKGLLLNSKELEILKNKIKSSLSLFKNENIFHNLHNFFEAINSPGATNGKFDLNMPNKCPCYHGWIHSRILADGRVSPCAFTNNLIMGDLKKNSFMDIWNSKKYKEFRGKCLNGLDDDYFSTSCCQHNCFYFRVNQRMHDGVVTVKNNYLKKLQLSSPQSALQLWLEKIDPILERKLAYILS